MKWALLNAIDPPICGNAAANLEPTDRLTAKTSGMHHLSAGGCDLLPLLCAASFSLSDSESINTCPTGPTSSGSNSSGRRRSHGQLFRLISTYPFPVQHPLL